MTESNQPSTSPSEGAPAPHWFWMHLPYWVVIAVLVGIAYEIRESHQETRAAADSRCTAAHEMDLQYAKLFAKVLEKSLCAGKQGGCQ